MNNNIILPRRNPYKTKGEGERALVDKRRVSSGSFSIWLDRGVDMPENQDEQ